MDYDDRDVGTYQFLFALSEADKKMLTHVINILITDFRNVPKVVHFDDWINERLEQQQFDLLWLVFDIHHQFHNEKKLNIEIPSFAELDNMAESYQTENDTEMRFMLWIDVLRQQYQM